MADTDDLRYEEPQPLSREDAERVFLGDDPAAIPSALVGMAFNDPDAAWVTGWCVRLGTHPDVWVRRISATCLGHVGRLHGHIDVAAAGPVLRRLSEDPETRDNAENALSDIQVFTGIDLSAG